MKNPALLTTALVLASSAAVVMPAAAALDDVLVVTPTHPTDQVPVSLTASGWHSDGCWELQVPHTCVRNGNQIDISFQSTDHWVPGVACITVIQDFSGTCDLGVLAAGTYSVSVVENQATLRPSVPIARQFSFEVTAAVANERLGWTTLKALYRQD